MEPNLVLRVSVARKVKVAALSLYLQHDRAQRNDVAGE